MQLFVREVVLAVQVDVLPGDDRAVADGVDDLRPALICFSFIELLREVEVVPADDRVFDQPAATFGDLLLLFVSVRDLLIVAERNSFGELLRALDLIELLFD